MLSFMERHLGDVVFVQQLHNALWLEAADECVPYEKTFCKPAQVALPPADSVELIAERLLELQAMI